MVDFKKVLVVDDSGTARMIVMNILKIAGLSECEFVQAEDGLDALEKLDEQSDIDLIVTDIVMPKIDGSTFVKKVRLKETYNQVKILVFTSLGKETIEKKLNKAKVSAIIQKPITPDKVAPILDAL